MKKYEIARGPYWGEGDELNSELNIVAGLVNLRVMWPKIKHGTAPLVSQADQGRDVIRPSRK